MRKLLLICVLALFGETTHATIWTVDSLNNAGCCLFSSNQVVLNNAVFIGGDFPKAYRPQEQGVIVNGSPSLYSRIGITTGFSIFEPAKSTHLYGNYTVTNLPTGVFHLGVSYSIIQSEKWVVNTGLIWSNEPDIKMNLSPLLEGDVYPVYEGTTVWVTSKISSYTIPIYVERQFRIKNSFRALVLGGFNLAYLPQLYSDVSVVILNEGPPQMQEIFNLVLDDNGNNFRLGFVLGTGVVFPVKSILQLSIKATYTLQYESSVSGNYVVDNLFISPPSGGSYTFTGNYFQVSFGFQFLKKKKK